MVTMLMTWVTPNPPNHPISTYALRFIYSLVSEHRDFKFDVRADHSKTQPMDDKLSLNEPWSCHVTNFKFLVPLTA